MLRYLIIGISLLVSSLSYGQYKPSDHSTFATLSVGSRGENYIRIEHDIRDDWVMAQTAILAGPEGAGFQFKVGACKTFVFGGYEKSHIFRWYLYFPYLNWSFTKGGYNTPFCTEIFYGRRQFQGSVNFDIYKNAVIPSVRFRCRLVKFKA